MRAKITKKLIESLKPKEKQYEVRDTSLKGLMVRVMPTGIMSYAVEYGRGRKFTIGPTSLFTPIQARERAKEILADFVRGIDPQEAKRKAKVHTFESYIEQVYAPWVEAHQRSAKTTISRLRANFFPLIGKTKLADITPWQIEKWRSQRLKEGVKPASINRYVATLKSSLSRAVEWGYIQANPLASVKQLKLDSQGVIRYLSGDEETRLRDALEAREEHLRLKRDSANAWRRARGYKLLPDLKRLVLADYLKPMVLVSLNTGLRRGELFNLSWTDVDFSMQMLTVRGSSAKSGKTRHIPLNEEAFETLSLWRLCTDSQDLVFPNKDGKRLTHVKRSFASVLKQAGITNFRWHDMRHHFASRLVMAGVDLNTVRELLGHADIKMTLRYAHLSPEVKQAAVDKLVSRDTERHKVSLTSVQGGI